jgi:acyl-CoA synthetase (AMP-forming)/AMP-acid ligase II
MMSREQAIYLDISSHIVAQAERAPDAVAIRAPERTPLTYRRLLSQTDAVRERLNSIGIGRNDRVVIVLDNGPELAVAFIAMTSCVTCIPLNPTYRAEEFGFYISRLNAKALVIAAEDSSTARDVARSLGLVIVDLVPERDAEAGIFSLACSQTLATARTGFAQASDLALLLHTSGTTSSPKIVPLTQQNICAMANSNKLFLELTADDLCLNVMPLFHSTGLIGVTLSSVVSGAAVVCLPGFYAPKFFEWLKEFEPTWFTAVPSMHQAILARAEKSRELIANNRLRFIRSSSSALPRKVLTELEEVFHVPVIESYGMTECGMIACNPLPPRKHKLGSVGVATSIDLKIANESGTFLTPPSNGEIVVHGDCVMAGYEDASASNDDFFANGWFRTGDQGFLDNEGYLFLTGRLKEIINRGGEKISPFEVDQTLLEHPAVEQAVTFPVVNEVLGEEVAAAVVLAPGSRVTASEIREFTASRLADFKVPRQVLIVDQIPQGSFGKIQRCQLANALGVKSHDQQPRAGVSEFTAPRTPDEAMMAEIWAHILGVEMVGVNDDFFNLGGDSILATQVISQMREVMRVELSLVNMFETPTIAELARSLISLRHKVEGSTPGRIKPIPRV